MIRRLWHRLVVGHHWKIVSSAYNRGTNQAPGTYEMAEEHKRQQCWGWTDVMYACPCGATKRHRLTGDHSKITSISEVDELERMLRKS